MAYKIAWSLQARDDLREIMAFITTDNTVVAETIGYQLISNLGKSQRDSIIQPSVAATKSRLRWVTNQNEANPEGVESTRGKTTMQPFQGCKYFGTDNPR